MRSSLRRNLRNHLGDDIALKLAIQNPAGIAQYVKNHFLRRAQVLRDTGKIIRE